MSEKPTLILLPGLLCDAALWADQVIGLYEVADIEVADLTGQDTMAGLAESVLDAAPDHFAIAGLSMGGYVALEIMRQAPERVSHLALLDTNASADNPEQSERRLQLIKLAEDGGLGKVAHQMLPALVHSDHVDLPHVGGTFLAMAERVGVEGFVHQQKAIMNRADSQKNLDAINCPSLVLCGADDLLSSPDIHSDMAKSIGKNANFVCVEASGHLSTLENPKAVTEALRVWLTGN